MRLTKAVRRLARETAMLGFEWARHGERRGYAYAAVGAAAALLMAIWAYDANSTAIGTKPSIQRATTW